MNLKRELEDVKALARSGWVRGGVALELVVILLVGFFAVDIGRNDGRFFFALVLADGGDKADLAFAAVGYAVLAVAITGGVCVLIGCWKVVKARSESPGNASENTGR